MARYLENILDGIRQVLVLWPEREYIFPSRGDFYKDNNSLRSDSNVVAKNIRRGLKQYGETDYRKSQESQQRTYTPATRN